MTVLRLSNLSFRYVAMVSSFDSGIKAVLGPTNTGKTHYAIERLCAHSSGIMGFPLRLLAREVYDRVVAIKGAAEVGLITGEERIVPPGARWLLCTMESMPTDRDVAFVGLDEVQLGSDSERGHVFTSKMLHARGREETLILGSAALAPIIRDLLPGTEIVSRPRFSKLSYAPPKKLSRLPPRSAIIAFSADQVYAIAEQVRRTLGGAAIVMGSLSPRTRNAQIAMYEAGEVDYLVATDAIGMGLNMDISHVAFAGLTKFDGTRQRRLYVQEMAQIAGRAGRHQRDGTFGIALSGQDVPQFSESEIERIEEHRFPALDWLYWRNVDLSFGSAHTLLDSLDVYPPDVRLRPSPIADDQAVLRILSTDPDVEPLLRGEAQVRRLWDACGLPDFRSTGPDFHARLVARLYRHLGAGNGTIPVQLIADEVARLDTVQGDIPALAARLASIRTWTYAANRADWLSDPFHWAARTREVEHRLSDTLHLRLAERFVDRRAARFKRGSTNPVHDSDFAVDPSGLVTVLDEPVGKLCGFRFIADADARQPDRRKLLVEAEARLPTELARRAQELEAAPDQAFALLLTEGEKIALTWRGNPVAKLSRGRDFLRPLIEVDASITRLEPKLRDPIRERLVAFVAAQIDAQLKPLLRLSQAAFSPDTPPLLRAFLAPLAEAGGVLRRSALQPILQTLPPEHRHQAKQLGLTIGSLGIFHPALLKPGATRLRLALLAVRSNQLMPPVPMPGLGLLDRPSLDLASAAIPAGFYTFGDQMLRFDLLERVVRGVHDQRKGALPFTLDGRLATTLGIGAGTLARVMRAIGFAPVDQNGASMWRWRGLRNTPQLTNSTTSNREKRPQ
jgi:ATP-dependent RNA helicase SUPV3L1/SUV3